MLVKNGASVAYAATLIAVIILGLYVQLTVGVLSVVPRLHSDIRRIQWIDLAGSVARLCVLGALLFVFLNAGVAVSVGAGTFLLQYFMLRKYAAGVVNLHAPENEEDRNVMRGFIRNQAANAIWRRLSAIPGALDAAVLPGLDDDTLCGLGGLTRQRAAHARALASAVASGQLDFAALAAARVMSVVALAAVRALAAAASAALVIAAWVGLAAPWFDWSLAILVSWKV